MKSKSNQKFNRKTCKLKKNVNRSNQSNGAIHEANYGFVSVKRQASSDHIMNNLNAATCEHNQFYYHGIAKVVHC